MNGLYKFVLIVSLVLAIEAKHKELSDASSVKFPNGFFCNLICQKWHVLKGNTVTCFISDNGDYHRFIGRNPAYGVWRFYKVDERADLSSLCKVSVNGDKFFLNNTEVMCSIPGPPVTTLRPHSNKETDEMEHLSISDEKDDKSSLEPTLDSKRLFLKDLIHKINEEVAKIFKKKTDETTTEAPQTEPENPEARSANRFSIGRSEKTVVRDIPPMDEICQLALADVCQEQKMITCETNGHCCWEHVNKEPCSPESMEKYNECYEGLAVLMTGLLY